MQTAQIQGGDAAQQARRAASIDLQDRPAYWLNAAWNDLRTGMNGNHNTPTICFRNCVASLVAALERGASDIDLCAGNPPGINGMPTEGSYVRVWHAIAVALELEALAQFKAAHDNAAQDEAITSMTPVTQVPG